MATGRLRVRFRMLQVFDLLELQIKGECSGFFCGLTPERHRTGWDGKPRAGTLNGHDHRPPTTGYRDPDHRDQNHRDPDRKRIPRRWKLRPQRGRFGGVNTEPVTRLWS